jgi:hypothetical protein
MNRILFIGIITFGVLLMGCLNHPTLASTYNSDSSIAINQPQETFFGQWTIKRMIAHGRVTTWGGDDIDKILGRTMTYSAEKASCFGERPEDLDDVAVDPVYLKSVQTKSEFEKTWNGRITFEKLGIMSDTVQCIRFNDSRGNHGGGFMIKDDDTLIVYGGGVYFKLSRVAQN